MKTVPYVLSIWAIFTDREPATRFLDKIDDETRGTYVFKAGFLLSQGLEACIEHVLAGYIDLEAQHHGYNGLDLLLRPHRGCSPRAHSHSRPGPTFIHNDPRVLPHEKNFALEFSPKAQDRRKKRLFTKVEETKEYKRVATPNTISPSTWQSYGTTLFLKQGLKIKSHFTTSGTHSITLIPNMTSELPARLHPHLQADE